MPDVLDYEVVSDTRAGEGGFLRLRRLRLRLVRDDGSRTPEGLYDYVERPKGLDAVVLALWTRAPDGGVQVLLREGLRVPLVFGRPERPRTQAPQRLAELVAGILEVGEESEEALRERAAAEAWEEAGLRIPASAVRPLGPPAFPTPGMCAELFFFASCEVPWSDTASAHLPPGDGSPFEEGARLRWLPLDAALALCARGELQDLKTEVALRRLREQLG
jgi:ADP-ribose pyrophosphatase